MRFLASLLLLTLTAACGFQPVYADKAFRYNDDGHADEKLQNVRLLPLADRSGQRLQNMLIDRMYRSGYPKQPPYALEITLHSEERELGIQKDATATRAELIMTANMVLRKSDDYSELYRTIVRTRVSYNILEAQYGTLVARENADDRGLTQLADEIVNRLSLYFSRVTPSGTPVETPQ